MFTAAALHACSAATVRRKQHERCMWHGVGRGCGTREISACLQPPAQRSRGPASHACLLSLRGAALYLLYGGLARRDWRCRFGLKHACGWLCTPACLFLLRAAHGCLPGGPPRPASTCLPTRAPFTPFLHLPSDGPLAGRTACACALCLPPRTTCGARWCRGTPRHLLPASDGTGTSAVYSLRCAAGADAGGANWTRCARRIPVIACCLYFETASLPSRATLSLYTILTTSLFRTLLPLNSCWRIFFPRSRWADSRTVSAAGVAIPRAVTAAFDATAFVNIKRLNYR